MITVESIQGVSGRTLTLDNALTDQSTQDAAHALVTTPIHAAMHFRRRHGSRCGREHLQHARVQRRGDGGKRVTQIHEGNIPTIIGMSQLLLARSAQTSRREPPGSAPRGRRAQTVAG